MRFIIIFLFWLTLYFGVYAENTADSIKNKVMGTASFSSVIFGFDFSNNATKDSRLNNLVNQSSYYPYISYYAAFGLFLNTGINIIGNSDSTLSKSTFSADFLLGYDFKIGKHITITPTYSYYLFDKNTMLLNKLYTSNTDVSLSFEYGNLTSIISAGYKWGKIDDWNSNIKCSYTISFEKVFSKNDLFIVQPTISIGLGNPNYYNKLFTFLDRYIETHPTANLSRMVYDIFHIGDQSPELVELRRKIREDRDLAYMIRDYLPSGIPLSEVLNSNNKFTLVSSGISLPISYLAGDFTFSASFSASRTLNQPVYLENKWYTYWSAGISYAINW